MQESYTYYRSSLEGSCRGPRFMNGFLTGLLSGLCFLKGSLKGSYMGSAKDYYFFEGLHVNGLVEGFCFLKGCQSASKRVLQRVYVL